MLTDVIRIADELCPNPYTEEEKWRWVDEVSALLCQEYRKHYQMLTCRTEGGILYLPQDVAIEQVAGIWCGGARYDKSDFRSDCSGGRTKLWNANLLTGSPVQIAFLSEHSPVRRFVLEGKWDTAPHLLKLRTPLVAVRDDLEITIQFDEESNPDWEQAFRCHVISLDEEGTHLAGDPLSAAEEKRMAIRRIVTDTTVLPAPYDSVYVEYLLAKMAFYQRDGEGYRAHMAQFNEGLDAYERWYKQRAPINQGSNFRGLWK